MAIAFTLRKISTAFVLAWKKEANWASPPMYFIYSMVRPLAMAMTIWVMYAVAGRPHGYLEPAWFSNAAFQLVPAVLGGTSWAVLEDRERYQMFKYIYLAPGSVVPYLAGHALARSLQAIISAVLICTAGAFILGLRPPEFHPLLMAASLFLGIIALMFLGLALAGGALHVARHGHFMTESIGAIFFLFSGAVFPVDTLPFWLRPISYASPVTWWLESYRRALGLHFGHALSGFSDAAILGILAAFAAASVAIGLAGWSTGERRAKWKGRLDMTTGY